VSLSAVVGDGGGGDVGAGGALEYPENGQEGQPMSLLAVVGGGCDLGAGRENGREGQQVSLSAVFWQWWWMGWA
jgi:hypothetical protein